MMEVELSRTIAKVFLLAGLSSPECFRSDLEHCLLLARAWDGVRPTICFFFRLYSVVFIIYYIHIFIESNYLCLATSSFKIVGKRHHASSSFESLPFNFNIS